MSQSYLSPTTRTLDRVLGPWMATALIIGTVIGSGVFKKPSAVARFLPESGLALSAWIVMGVLILMGALALAEVAVMLPRAGGNYVFLREAYGRWAGFLWGWVEFWIIRSASIAALAFIFVESLHDVLREVQGLDASREALTFWQRQFIILGVIAFLAMINARGTVLGAGLQVLITTVKVVSLVAIAALPFIIVMLGRPQATMVGFENMAPVWPADWSAVSWSNFGGALVAVFWAYHGWMNIAPVAGEVQNPRYNIPMALLTGTMIIMIVYVSANFAYYLVMPGTLMTGLDAVNRPVAAAFGLRLLGPIGLMLASAAIMTSVFGALNGNMLVGPRLLFAMGQDRMAPSFLGELHSTWRTPMAAIAILAGWSMSLVMVVALLKQYRVPVIDLAGFQLDLNLDANADSFGVLTDYAMFGALAFETLAVAAIFVLRGRQQPGSDSYRCPLYPLLPLIFVLAMAAILFNMFVTSRTQALAGVGLIFLGGIMYPLVDPVKNSTDAYQLLLLPRALTLAIAGTLGAALGYGAGFMARRIGDQMLDVSFSTEEWPRIAGILGLLFGLAIAGAGRWILLIGVGWFVGASALGILLGPLFGVPGTMGGWIVGGMAGALAAGGIRSIRESVS